MTTKKKLIKLFISTLYLSAFTFGGGYVIVTLMRQKFVNEYHWIEEDEMYDFIAIAQSSPGPIAVNGAIVVGYKLGGFFGIIVSVVATILPPFFIISCVSLFYNLFKENVFMSLMMEGMQAGVGAVIASVVFEMVTGILKDKNILYIFIMICAFVANYCLKVNVVYIILICILLGVIQTIYNQRRKER